MERSGTHLNIDNRCLHIGKWTQFSEHKMPCTTQSWHIRFRKRVQRTYLDGIATIATVRDKSQVSNVEAKISRPDSERRQNRSASRASFSD